MANEALFQALAQARANPSKALRAVQSGAQAVNDTVGGVLQGQQIRQQLDQNRLLQTPLGSLYSDPSQIPYGLQPQHTVKDLMTLAPVMQGHVPQSTAQGIVNAYMGGGGQQQPQDQAPPSIAPNQPVPSIVRNPPQAQGQTNLQGIQGTGAGNQNLVPPGQPINLPPAPSQPLNQPPATQVVGNSGASGSPSVVVPPGGIGKEALQLLEPALNAAREGSQFQQGVNAENARFNAGQTNENSRFATGQANENARSAESLAQARDLANIGHMASAAEKISPSVQELGGIKDLITQIEPLIQTDSPISGNMQANVASRLGGRGTPQMQRSLAINNNAAGLSTELDKLMAGRFNEDEAKLLKQTMLPLGNGTAQYNQDQIAKLKGFVGTLEQGNNQAIQNMASALTGGKINTVAPSSGPAQASTSIPMLRVKNIQTGQTGTIPANKFDPNRYAQLS